MTELEQIEDRVRKLSPDDFEAFRKWFREQEWDEWDRQIEHDSRSGKLKALAEKALADHAAGKTNSRPAKALSRFGWSADPNVTEEKPSSCVT